jgi:hypothetical protein
MDQKMSVPFEEMSIPFAALLAVAREFIRSEGHTSISPLLEELSHKFGDRFPKWPDAFTVLEVIEALWADPYIDQVPNTGYVAFAWNERGGVVEILAPDEVLLDRVIARARREGS